MSKLQKIIHYCFLVSTTFLFLLIPIYLLNNNFSFLFRSDNIQNLYGFLSPPIIICTSIFIFFLEIKNDDNFPYKKKLDYIRSFNHYIGVKPLSSNRIIKGMICGIALFIVDYILKILLYQHFPMFKISNFVRNLFLNFEHTISSLTIVPIFEELIYRGLFLRSYEIILKKGTMIYPLIISSFIFGFIHPNLPMLKVIGGVLLGYIYLWKDKRNLDLVIYSHIMLNLIMSFFYS